MACMVFTARNVAPLFLSVQEDVWITVYLSYFFGLASICNFQTPSKRILRVADDISMYIEFGLGCVLSTCNKQVGVTSRCAVGHARKKLLNSISSIFSFITCYSISSATGKGQIQVPLVIRPTALKMSGCRVERRQQQSRICKQWCDFTVFFQ